MTLFYGARTAQQLAFRDELDALSAKGLKVVYVLSDETCDGCEHGFVSAALMEKYVDIRESSFFLCGPQAMYDFVLKELAPYDLPRKAVRKDAGSCGNREVSDPRTFRLTVHVRDKVCEISAQENETLLTAMERAASTRPTSAARAAAATATASGCAANMLLPDGRDGRREADRKFGFIHPCVTYPASDIELIVPVGE